MKKIQLVVTRHPALIQYLIELGMADTTTEVVAHATPEALQGKRVLGVLPHSLSSVCESFTEIPLNLPPELRGVELTLEQIREYALPPATYKVVRMD